MKFLYWYFLINACCFFAQEEILYESTKMQNVLLELFTSEGCSSCPPADTYLSTLKKNEDLWRTIFPVAFHVDYWDYLGWRDIYGSKSYSLRQRKYAHLWRSNSIYTPGFVLNGKEWRTWRKQKKIESQTSPDVGIIQLVVDKKSYKISFYPKESFSSEEYNFNLALLGNEITSKIDHGENAGRTLKHDFVVLHYLTGKMEHSVNSWHKTVKKIDTAQENNATSYSIVAWTNTEKSVMPVQVTGGFIDLKNIYLSTSKQKE